MRKVPHVRPHRWGAAVVAGAAALTLLGAGPSAYAADDDRATPVDVSVTNKGKTLREGDSTTYTVTLRNRTDRPYRGLTVSQTMPASLHPSGTDPEAKLKPGRATWRTDLPANGTETLTLDGDIGTIDEHEAGQAVAEDDPKRPEGAGYGRGKTAVRLSTNVCVQESVKVPGGKPEGRGGVDNGSGQAPGDNTVGRIIGCASDADVLHASPSEGSAGESHPWLYGSAGVALVAAGAGAFALHRRRST